VLPFLSWDSIGFSPTFFSHPSGSSLLRQRELGLPLAIWLCFSAFSQLIFCERSLFFHFCFCCVREEIAPPPLSPPEPPVRSSPLPLTSVYSSCSSRSKLAPGSTPPRFYKGTDPGNTSLFMPQSWSPSRSATTTTPSKIRNVSFPSLSSLLNPGVLLLRWSLLLRTASATGF